MSDEPVEEDDSESDARDTSPSDGSEEAEGDAEESRGRPGYTPDHVTSPANGSPESETDGPTDASSEDTDAPSSEDVNDSPGDDTSDPPSDATSGHSTDDAATTSDDAPEDEPDDSGTDVRTSDHAPVGADAPSPDEGSAPAETASGGGTTATASATGAGSGGGGSSFLSGGIGGSAPPDDEEMPLTEHIEEMLTRLAVVVVVASLATLAVFPFANDIIIEMWYDVHSGSVDACRPNPQSDDCVAPHVYGPLELVLTRIRVAGLAGLLVALPLGVYQTYRFMRPGLYPHERRYYLAAVPFSLLLGIVGMLFAYFVVLPLLFAYFIGYTEGSAELAFQLAETMNLILLMMGMLAIIFQIPLLIMLAIMMGITTREWLESHRLYFWGLFLGVAVIFGPDPTGMAPFLLTATMVVLFEGTLLLLRWTGR